ncbi:MAG: response regulator transcription factor [Chloroflexota bacterium]|nr:response regulator transcription factor [Chloroflexota bacterium]
MDAIRVLIVDDHQIVREGLRSFLQLQDGIEVVGEAVDGAEALEKVGELVPDVVLIDLVMPGMDGIAAIRKISALSPSTRVLVLTSFAEDDKVFPAIKAGAHGYLMKEIRPADLADSIRAVYRGEPSLHPDIAKKLMEQLSRDEESYEPEEDLTTRETEVLRLLARGQSNREIAATLGVSEKTVKAHVSNILHKLHVADRTQAALYAVRQRIAEGRQER